MKGQSTKTGRASFLSSLTAQERRRLLEISRALTLPAGTHLVQPGEAPTHVAFVQSGLLAVSEVPEETTGRITVLAGPEGFAPVGLLSEAADAQVQIWAMVDSEVLQVDAASLRKLLAEGGPLTVAVLDYVTRLSRRLAADLQLNKDFNLVQRTAAALLEISDRLQTNMVPVSHDTLGRRLGTVREVATESLGQLREEDLIETLYRRIEIVDAKGLQKRAGGAYRRFSV